MTDSTGNTLTLPTGILKATITFSPSPIPSGTIFGFSIANMKNPPSTKPVQLLSTNVLDLDKVVIENYSVKPLPYIVMK